MSVEKKVGVVLFQLGGPDSLEAVEPFLYNLFCDPDIIDLPGAFLFRKPLARLISSRRSPKVRELYSSIGGRSPILEQTLRQANALKAALKKKGVKADVHIALRYWHPFTEETVKSLSFSKHDQLVLLPLYPHFSKATTGSSFNEWQRITSKLNFNSVSTTAVESYFGHPRYIDALVGNIKSAMRRFPKEEQKKVHLVFSAHGIPVNLVNKGDPYSRQIETTYRLVVERGNFGIPHHLCFQSKVGPQKWLEPSLTFTIEQLARQKVSSMLVVPISFVTEHIETLSEINIEARRLAEGLGVKYFAMMPALIDNEEFIACLTDLVLKQVKN